MKLRLVSSLVVLCLLNADATHACCALGRIGEPVVNADQTVLIIWDPATKTEHFIRKASFKAEGGDFGFLVPTPSRPQLSESGNEAFPHLADITRPRSKPRAGFGCAASPEAYAIQRNSVTVLERKEVAGFDAAVLSASSPSALTGWLKKNGYHFSPEVAAWAAPYVRDGWMFTALKVAKRNHGETAVQAGALRISFHTERPLFPYREPDSRADARKVGASSRLLRLYFIGDARYAGSLDGAPWSGKAVWSRPLPQPEKESLLRELRLPADSGPERWWLTEFEDRWPYGVAPGDLYFAPAKSQGTITRWAAAGDATTDISLGAGLALAAIVLMRKKPARTAPASQDR